MKKGKVRWFNDTKGFGFIESEGKDYFVHYKSIQGMAFKSLKEGQFVSFTPQQGIKGAVALDVSVEHESNI